MPFPADRVQVRVPPVEDKLHESFLAFQDASPHAFCAGFGYGVQTLYGDAKVQRAAVCVVLDPHPEAQGSELQVQGSGRVRATAHLLTPPNRRRALADSTTEGRHSVSLTSCH